jgi:hypothetical protein
MRTFMATLESFLVMLLLFSGIALGLYGLVTAQMLLDVLGLIVFIVGFCSMLYVWINYPESRNDTSDSSFENGHEKMAKAFYSWESLPQR